jgi:hypothetical protein
VGLEVLLVGNLGSQQKRLGTAVIVAMGWVYVSMELGLYRALCPSPRWCISECGAAVEW